MPSALSIPAWVAALCASPVAGSFVGVLIRRLPQAKSAGWTHSECEACHRTLSAFDLVPVVSYLVLRGRCRHCGASIAPFHLVIELLCTLVTLWAALVDRDPAWLWTACFLGWTLLALGWIDAQHMRLPDVLTLPLLTMGLGAQALMASGHLLENLLGAVIGYASFRGIACAYHSLRGREGLGGGDAKLVAAGGAWLGWSVLPDFVLLAVLLAIFAVMVMRIRGYAMSQTTAIPFGSFLAASMWLTYLYGPLLFDPH